MKLFLIVTPLFFLSPIFSFAQNEVEIIKEFKVTPDHVENGAKGIKLEVTYSFDFLKSTYSEDSLRDDAMFGSTFNLYIRASENSKAVAVAMGHNSLGDDKKNLRLNHSIPSFAINYKDGKTSTMFVPYASLKLTSSEHTLKFHAIIKGKDGKNVVYKGKEANSEISFLKPPTKVFEVSLDSLVINYFDSKGQAWDHSLFGSDAPDLDFNILLGTAKIGNIYKGNAYFISFPNKPRVFKFMISENDEVLLLLNDRDDVFDDEVSTWRFISENMNAGTYYEQTQAKSNMRSFSFRCKVE